MFFQIARETILFLVNIHMKKFRVNYNSFVYSHRPSACVIFRHTLNKLSLILITQRVYSVVIAKTKVGRNIRMQYMSRKKLTSKEICTEFLFWH